MPKSFLRTFLVIGPTMAMLITMAMLTGCAAKKQARTNLVIEPRCLTAPIEMVDCDQSSPPRCLKSVITYKKGCEYIKVSKHE